MVNGTGMPLGVPPVSLSGAKVSYSVLTHDTDDDWFRRVLGDGSGFFVVYKHL